MRISARSDYACKALLKLSLHWPNEKPVSRNEISEEYDIPMKYLVQILIQLKGMGILESVRGKKGGYRLIKPPSEITLSEVLRETGGPFLPLADSVVEEKTVFSKIWKEVEGAMAKILDNVTFEDISNRAKGAEKAITYQI